MLKKLTSICFDDFHDAIFQTPSIVGPGSERVILYLQAGQANGTSVGESDKFRSIHRIASAENASCDWLFLTTCQMLRISLVLQ